MSDMNLLLEAGGCVAGYGAYKVVNKALRVPYSVYIANEMNLITPQKNTEFKMAIDTVLKSSGLKDKNVIVEHIDEAKAKAIAENMFSTLSNGQRKFNNILLRVLKDTDIEKIKGKIYTIGKGKNACFIPKQNSIYLNKDKMAFSAFHEMGHAINYNGKGIKHLLHKLRGPFSLAIMPILYTSLSADKNVNRDDKFSSKIDNFVKDNCGTLTLACMAPTVIEEGVASINANRITKGILSDSARKTMNSLNKKAWLSYVVGSLALAGSIKTAVLIKDKISNLGNK